MLTKVKVYWLRVCSYSLCSHFLHCWSPACKWTARRDTLTSMSLITCLIQAWQAWRVVGQVSEQSRRAQSGGPLWKRVASYRSCSKLPATSSEPQTPIAGLSVWWSRRTWMFSSLLRLFVINLCMPHKLWIFDIICTLYYLKCIHDHSIHFCSTGSRTGLISARWA